MNANLERLEHRNLLAGDLVAHWTAQDLMPTHSAGEDLVAWVDSQNNIEARAIGTPMFDATAVGGRAAIRFDPEDGADYLRINSADSPLQSLNDFSVAAVFATSSTELLGSDGNWFQNSAIVDSSSLGLAADWGISMTADGSLVGGIGGGFGNSPTNVRSISSNLNDNEVHLVILSRNGDELSLQVDDLPAVVQNGTSISPLSRLDVSFGAQKLGGNAFEGHIAEIRMFNGALDNAQRADLYAEVATTYDNRPPQAVDDSYSLDEDPLLFVVNATDGVLKNDSDAELDPITAELIEPTQNGTISLNANGSFIYNPRRDFFGVDSFTYSAVDTRGSVPATVTLNVRPTYDRPTLNADSFKMLPGQPLSVPTEDGVLANDINADQVPLVVSLVEDVSAGELTLNDDGSFQYNSGAFAGVTQFSYQVNDGTETSSPQQVTLIVNTPPDAADDELSTSEDNVVSGIDLEFLRNDSDADQNPFVFEIVDLPTNGVLQTDNGLVYVPNQDFFGTDLFSYKLADEFDESRTATVNISIEPVNDVPIAVEDSFVGFPNEPLVRGAANGVLANDTDVDSSGLTAILVSPPSLGQLHFEPDGSFVFTPPTDYLGELSFEYRASDSIGESSAIQVELIVTDTPIVISEFMAQNSSTLETQVRYAPDDEFFPNTLTPDWIELKNLTDATIDVGGMFLTDDSERPQRWRIPDNTTIAGSEFLIVYASGLDLSDPSLDREGRLHANFSLDSKGDYLALADQDGAILTEFESFPNQKPDVSYGEFDEERQFFPASTPLAENASGVASAVADTAFSVDRGFLVEPTTVEITTETPGATIVYTVDGSVPTLENGMVVNAANADSINVVTVAINQTTTLRAAAFKDGSLPTNVDTHSYFFVADLVEQRFSSQIRDNPEWNSQLADSLTSLPAISLVTGDRISQRENPLSVEMIFPDGSESGFQIDAGVEHYGGHSLGSPKKNMRLSFKSLYGDGSLKYDLFGEGATDEFEQILLRTGSHDTWFWTHPAGGRGNYTRNRWAFDRQMEMGHLAPHGRYVQVFINGEYEGMHHLMERPNADFMASYAGGQSFEYDALNAGSPIDGDSDAWREVSRTRDNTVMEDYEEVKKFIDVENYADYLLLQFYSGNDWDWNHAQNWSAARKREEGAGFNFFSWDSDVLLRTTANANVINRGGPGNLWNVSGGMKQHEEFLMLLADRAQKYFFNDGMFTDDRLRADIQEIADHIRLPLIAETGRWGGRNYTPDVWEGAIEWMFDRFAPEGEGSRAVTTIDQMRRAGIYPAVEAPQFTVNGVAQHGGDINSADAISLQTSDGAIYYGLGDVDPRLPGGTLNPAALALTDEIRLDESAVINARVLKDGEWSALAQTRFRVNTVPADVSNLRISEINYHPSDVTESERLAGFSDADNFEFMELVNISNSTIDLSQVRFRRVDVEGDLQGVDFNFSHAAVTELAPGDRLVVVEHIDAFRLRYGDEINVAGQWNGGLSNKGETISLQVGDQIIHEFAYADSWYEQTDGGGFTLQIIDETMNASEWGQATSWRASNRLGGSPGTDDANTPVPGDSNRDGIFDSSDLVLVFRAGEFEDDVAMNSTFEEGDWDGDGDFTTGDLVHVFQAGNYVAASVPSEKHLIASTVDLLFDRDEKKKHGLILHPGQSQDAAKPLV